MVQTNEYVSLFASGYCVSHEAIVNPENGKGKTKFFAVWALIKHKELGYILYDTGYNKTFFTATKSFPDRFYRWVTPVYISENETAKQILLKEGISPQEIKFIIISHFHADHICGLNDFTSAKFICTKSAFELMNKSSGFKAVSKGILKKLIPENFNERVLFVEDISTQKKDFESNLTIFQVFEKENLNLVLLPGHARGMLGILLNINEEQILFASDAGWSFETFKKGILPKKITKIFFDSWSEYLETLRKIQIFLNKNSKTKILFTHCKETLKYVKNYV